MSLIQVIKIDKRGLDCVNSLLGTLVQSILQYLEMKRTQLWCWHGEKMYQVSLQPFISEECHWGWGTPTTWCTGTAWRRRKAGRSWAWIRRLWDLSRRKDVQPTSASRVPCVEVRHQTTSILEVFWSFFFTFIIWYVRTVLLLLQGLLQEVLLTPRHLLQVQVWQEWLYHHQWDKELHTLSSDKVPPGQNLCSGQWGAGLVWSTNQIQSWSISCSSLFLSQRFTASVIEYFLLNLFFHLTSPAFLIYTYHHLLRIVRGCVYRMCTRRVLPKKMNLKNCNWNLA